MYITLYKNNPSTTFTPPSATPSVSNYLDIVEGSNRSLWQCTRTGDPGGWEEIPNPGGIQFACDTCPPNYPTANNTICTCTIGYQRWYQYKESTYVYSWTKVQDGFPDIIHAGNLTEVIESITRRVHDLDTSNFEGLSDVQLDDPLIFVLKEEDDSIIYSGYVNSWSQDGKLCKFKGIDFKKIFDTEIKLDFYVDMPSVNLQVSTILNKVFNEFDFNQPPLSFTIPSITTDTAYISNLLGQVFTTNALKFIKVYLATFGLFILPMFNESTKQIDVSIISNNDTAIIRLDDFIFESQKTDTKTNKCIATIKKNDETENTNLYKWLPSNQEYYDSKPSSMKSVQSGFTIDANKFIVLTSSDAIISNLSGHYYLEIRINNTNLQKIVAWSGNGTPIYWFWIPYSDNFIFTSRVSRDPNSISRVGVGILNPLSDVLFETAKYPGNPAGGKNTYLQEHSYTDFGQGWFEGYINNITLPTATYIRIRIALKGNPPSGFLDSIVTKTIIASPEVIGSKEDFKTYTSLSIQNQTWYLRPIVQIPDDGSMPYGYAVKTTDGYITKYWQLGQVPREIKPLPEKSYYLGKDNEIYEDYIAPSNQIFPIQQKIVAEDFFYKAQFNAIYELVNSRFNENIIILDNEVLNPMLIEPLGLNAKVTVYDKMNNTAILPVSEIEIKKGQKRVKLGFKKTLFTEVIKS
jgi:hypothetical protein